MLTIKDNVEFSWAIGLFEGEGCISIQRAKNKSGPTVRLLLRLAMSDEDVVRRFHRAVGGVGVVRFLRRDRHPGWSNLYGWDLRHRREIIDLLVLMAPHFGARRRAKAQDAISADEQYPSRGLALNSAHNRWLNNEDSAVSANVY